MDEKMGGRSRGDGSETSGDMGVAKEQAVSGLAGLVDMAVRALAESLAPGKRERGSAQRSSDARYVLDAVLERLPEAERPAAGAGAPVSLDELAEARERLRKARLAERRGGGQ